MLRGPKKDQDGFVILFAVLLVSIVLTISLSLFNITFKQLVLSATARESQHAFFAADSAMNCAKHFLGQLDEPSNPFGYYHDCDPSTGANCTFTPGSFSSTNSGGVDCGTGTSILPSQITVDDGTPAHYKVSFAVKFEAVAKKSCALVNLDINYANAGAITKTIEVRGFNNYDEGADACPLQSDRTVERAQVMTY